MLPAPCERNPRDKNSFRTFQASQWSKLITVDVWFEIFNKKFSIKSFLLKTIPPVRLPSSSASPTPSVVRLSISVFQPACPAAHAFPDSRLCDLSCHPRAFSVLDRKSTRHCRHLWENGVSWRIRSIQLNSIFNDELEINKKIDNCPLPLKNRSP